MAKPTSESTMGTLHIKVSTRLTNEVKNKDSDPRYVQMAIKFLSDNKIYMTPEINNELGELDKHLQAKKKRFNNENITDIATKQAIAMGEE